MKSRHAIKAPDYDRVHARVGEFRNLRPKCTIETDCHTADSDNKTRSDLTSNSAEYSRVPFWRSQYFRRCQLESVIADRNGSRMA